MCRPAAVYRIGSVRFFASETSSDKEQSSTEFKTSGELRKALIKASFVHARTVGFNDNCIVDACRDFNLPSVSSGIVKKGPIEVVNHAMEFWLQ